MHSSGQVRRYDFDAIRAVMMLLGIVFHGCISFTVTDVSQFWPCQSDQGYLFFDAIVGTLHAFRIPTFFMISGFFLSMQLERKKLLDILRRRIFRILIPFILFTLILTPIIGSILLLILKDPNSEFVFVLGDNYSLMDIHTGHFWFLYYLILFHVIQFLIRLIFKNKIVRLLKHLKYGLFILILCQLGILFYWGNDSMHGQYSLLPSFSSLAYFACFYFFGNLMFYHLDEFDVWLKRSNYIFFFALLINSVYLLFSLYIEQHPNDQFSSNVFSVIIVLNVNFLIFCTCLFFHKFFNVASPLIRKLVDASYTIYVVHLFYIVTGIYLIQAFMDRPFIAAPILITSTYLASFGTYKILSLAKSTLRKLS